jgi:hypothetical protein
MPTALEALLVEDNDLRGAERERHDLRTLSMYLDRLKLRFGCSHKYLYNYLFKAGILVNLVLITVT